MVWTRWHKSPAATSIPLATNMIVLEFDQIAAAFRKNAVQIVLVRSPLLGGLRASTHLGKICETLGLGVSVVSNSHLGIAWRQWSVTPPQREPD